MLWKKLPVATCAAVLAVILALALSACGSSAASGSVSHTPVHGTVRSVAGFTVHAGLAFGAFKHFILTPYEEGKLSFRHPLTLSKAAAAALFALHEMQVAHAELGGHPALSQLLGSRVTLLLLALHLLRSHLLRGSTGGLGGAQSAISSLSSASAGARSPISAITSGLHL